jgi:hypothetical protein
MKVPAYILGQIAIGFAESEAEAGAREIGGNNAGPFCDKYLNANHPERISHQGEPWCVAFALWCWLQALRAQTIELPFAFTRSAGQLWERLPTRGFVLRTPRGKWSPDLQPGQLLQSPSIGAGDFAFWDWTGDGHPQHVNLVHHLDGDVLYTVGGNEGDEASGAPVRVKRRGALGTLPHLFGLGRMFADDQVQP